MKFIVSLLIICSLALAQEVFYEISSPYNEADFLVKLENGMIVLEAPRVENALSQEKLSQYLPNFCLGEGRTKEAYVDWGTLTSETYPAPQSFSFSFERGDIGENNRAVIDITLEDEGELTPEARLEWFKGMGGLLTTASMSTHTVQYDASGSPTSLGLGWVSDDGSAEQRMYVLGARFLLGVGFHFVKFDGAEGEAQAAALKEEFKACLAEINWLDLTTDPQLGVHE